MPDPARPYARLLARYLGSYRARAVLLGLLLLTGIILQVVNPQFLRRFIDAAQQNASIGVLTTAAVAYLVFGVVRRALLLGATYAGTDLGWRATNDLREDLTRHCVMLDTPFHKTMTPGQFIERIDGDVLSLANFFSQFAIRIVGSALLLVGILVALYLEDWRLGVSLTAFSVASLLLLGRMRDYALADSAREREHSAGMFGFIEERLSALEDIRANGAGAYVLRRFHEPLRAFTEATKKAWVKRSVIWLASLVLYGAGFIIAMVLGVVLYLSGAVTLGTAYLLTFYVNMLFTPIEQLTQQLQDLQKAGAGISRVAGLFAVPRQVLDGPVDSLPDGALPVDFRNVSFTYEDGDEAVLCDIQFALQPGTSLGLLGRTGSGKTTLSRLLFRLYDPSSGSIRLGGVPLPDLQLETLRSRVGMVTQDVQLFQATIRDNLTLFDRSIPDEPILTLMQDMGLGPWLDSQPGGLETVLQAGGGGLSAGEAQLLAFTRVFLKDPGVVILDEPSSRLDPATERLIDRAMELLLSDRTVIIIAHRLATVQRVDEIMIMEDGRIVEHGPREALAGDGSSRFRRLLRAGMMEESLS